MRKAEAVKHAEVSYASALKRADEMDNPAGYSGCHFSCELGRRTLKAIQALPEDWDGDYDETRAVVRRAYIDETVQRECSRRGFKREDWL